MSTPTSATGARSTSCWRAGWPRRSARSRRRSGAPTPEPAAAPAPVVAWRAFPWSRTARPGEKFSPSFVPATGGTGRFDLPGERVLYLAETPEHAIGEKIGRFRGAALRPSHLREYGLPLALVAVGLAAATRGALVDLCDPQILRARGIAPDAVAARERETTQAIAARLADAGAPGLRWWSSYFGEWHGLVLFADRLDAGAIEVGSPRVVEAGDPALAAALVALGMRWES